MARLPHRIYHGLQAIYAGAVTVGAFAKMFGNSLPQYKTVQRVLNESANRDSGLDWRERARREAIHIFYDLRRQGFAVEKADGMFLTKKGKECFKQLASRFKKVVPRKFYESKKANDLIIVSFDIPEKERQKRDWLRWTLGNLGLLRYHKSLWMGKIIIPEEFINDLATYQLDGYVAIFTAGKQGTLRKII